MLQDIIRSQSVCPLNVRFQSLLSSRCPPPHQESRFRLGCQDHCALSSGSDAGPGSQVRFMFQNLSFQDRFLSAQFVRNQDCSGFFFSFDARRESFINANQFLVKQSCNLNSPRVQNTQKYSITHIFNVFLTLIFDLFQDAGEGQLGYRPNITAHFLQQLRR